MEIVFAGFLNYELYKGLTQRQRIYEYNSRTCCPLYIMSVEHF